MNRKRTVVLGAVLALAVAAGAAGWWWRAGRADGAGADRTGRAASVNRLVIATGGVGGVYHDYGQGLAAAARTAFPHARVEVRTTAASVENLRLVADGTADVAFTLADAAALAASGTAPFPAPLPVVAVARLYDNVTHLVVRADSAVHSVADLRGRAVSTGAATSGTDLLAERLLRLAGLDPTTDVDRHQLGVQDSARALARGEIVGFFFSGGLPTPAIADLTGAAQVRLIGLAGFVPALRRDHGELYAERTIPASAYGLGQETATIGVPNLLVVNAAMPHAVAYALTRLLFTAKPRLVTVHPEARRLNRRAATSTYPLPLHPGAAGYYRDVKP